MKITKTVYAVKRISDGETIGMFDHFSMANMEKNAVSRPEDYEITPETFESDINLTDLEKKVITEFMNDCHVGDSGWDNNGIAWRTCLTDECNEAGVKGKTLSGVFSSLSKKGIFECCEDSDHGEDVSTVGMTEGGKNFLRPLVEIVTKTSEKTGYVSSRNVFKETPLKITGKTYKKEGANKADLAPVKVTCETCKNYFENWPLGKKEIDPDIECSFGSPNIKLGSGCELHQTVINEDYKTRYNTKLSCGIINKEIIFSPHDPKSPNTPPGHDVNKPQEILTITETPNPAAMTGLNTDYYRKHYATVAEATKAYHKTVKRANKASFQPDTIKRAAQFNNIMAACEAPVCDNCGDDLDEGGFCNKCECGRCHSLLSPNGECANCEADLNS